VGIHSNKTTGIDTMSFEETPESHLSAIDAPEQPHPHKGSWVRILVYLILVGLLGFVVWRIYQNKQQTAANTAMQAAALMSRPVPVQVAAAEQKPMPIFLTALGTVTPYMSVTVKARVSGELLPVKFTEGQQVRQGQTIMTIDPRPYKAALDQAKGTLVHDQALLTNAQAEYKRYKALYEAGNIITANTTNLVVINQFQPIAVYFTLPENQLPEVLHKLAADRRLPVDAYDRGDVQKLATGQLLTADNQIDTTTGTAKLKAVFDNKDQSLFPNQFVNIHLVLDNRPNALVIPSAAIQTGLQGLYVWVVDTKADGTATARIQPVKVALASGQVTILDSGLTPGQNVVVDGADRLRPGQIVIASATHQQSGQEEGQGGSSPSGPFAAPSATPHPGAQIGAAKGNGKNDKREKQ
jgi:multidrug efflux system membrane fusion protein